ncbi:MAG: hypothetical protein GY768_25690 [Planctomycetaceae bacterium]|nr:hypothetical protein [Planctomycetaceae bacterium]
MWLTQIKRIGSSFGAVLVTYWCYALIVVPLIEPALTRAKPIGSQRGYGRSTDPFQNELKGFFPEDAWEMGNAKVLRSGTTSLLFQDYKPNENGTIHIYPCTVVVRPETADQAPLIMQAPEGAILRLNQPIDLKSGQFGQPVAGRLQGKIRIHSPGRSDGTGRLLIETSNVQITTKRLWTANAVDVRFDQSHARGSDLIIQLAPQKNSAQADMSKGWAGIRSIELVKLEELHIQLAPKPSATSSDKSRKTISTAAQAVPVKVTCSGPFGIDFRDKVVTFDDQVHLRRLNPDQEEDSLRCDRLQMFLVEQAAESSAEGQEQKAETGQSRQRKMPKLDPKRIIAEGSPAVLDAPSKSVHVSGHKLLYDLVLRRFRLWADKTNPTDQVLFRFKTHQVLARELDATMQDPKNLDRLRAKGPGVYRGVLPGRNEGPLQAAWQGLLSIDQVDAGQVLKMRQDASIMVGLESRVDAYHIEVLFDRQPATSPAGGDEFPLRPQRMAAVSTPEQAVRIESPELTALTGRLEGKFTYQPRVKDQPSSAATLAGRQGKSHSPTTNPVKRLRRQEASERRMDVSCQKIEMQLNVVGKQVSMEQIDLRGQTRLTQLHRGADQEKSFDIAADAMRILDRDGNGSHVLVAVGNPVDIRAAHFRVRTDKLQLDQADNLLWTDGAGHMTMLIDRDLTTQQPLTVPQQITLDWQDRMHFNGQLASFHGNVDLRSPQRRLRSARLGVRFERRIEFLKSAGKQKPEIHTIQADGNVLVENQELDDQSQPTSVSYLQVPHIRYDHLAGDMFAEGPGRVVTHRRGFQSMQLPGAAANASAPMSDDGNVSFIQVDFQNQITGNMQRRAAEFQGQVKVIYGPVQSWNESINPDAVLGEKDVLMSCDRLSFAEGPTLPEGQRTVNLVAQENTYVEGKTFTARGQRLSYEQHKKLLILEGAARSDAVLSHQARVGAPRSETVARKILFWTDTQRVEVDDARYIDLSNLGF